MKAQVLLLVVVLAGAAALFFWYQPESREAHVPPAPKVQAAKPAPEIPAPPPTRRVQQEPDVEVVEDAPPPDAGVVDAAPKGPFTVPLGRHNIHLRDKPWVLTVELALVTPTVVTRQEISRARRTLVRMLFFLGSHRSKDGSLGEDGKARFRQDLLSRMRNVIKTGPISDLQVLHYEIAEYQPPPDGDVKPE